MPWTQSKSDGPKNRHHLDFMGIMCFVYKHTVEPFYILQHNVMVYDTPFIIIYLNEKNCYYSLCWFGLVVILLFCLMKIMQCIIEFNI